MFDSGIAQILENKVQRSIERAERKKEREETEGRQPLILERNNVGLYYVRYEKGPVPNLLKGHFTHKTRIYALAKEIGLEIKERNGSKPVR